MVQRKIHHDPEIFFYRSFSASPAVPHWMRVDVILPQRALMFSFSQIFLTSKLALECVDNNSVCKFIDCSLHSPIQVTNEITEQDMSEIKLFAVIPFGAWVGFDTEPFLTLKTIFRKNTNVLISFIQLWYLGFSCCHSDIRKLLPVLKEENTFLSLQI